jgi:hypothetical protein
MNLYPGIKGHYIYKIKNRADRYLAQIKYPMGYSRGGLFYSLDDAINWMQEQRAYDTLHPYTPVINT